MFSELVNQMKLREGITEQLKAENQLEWVRRMNNIRNRANEIIYKELIYVWAALFRMKLYVPLFV